MTNSRFPFGAVLFAFGFAGALPAATYQFQAINYPGASYTQPSAINNNGMVAGYLLDASGNSHGFTYTQGSFSEIIPGRCASNVVVRGVNDAGDLTGNCITNYGGSAFVETGGNYSYVTVGEITYGGGINNAGVWVGWYIADEGLSGGTFLANEGQLLKVSPYGSAGTIYPYALNNSAIVGQFGAPGSPTLAGFFNNGQSHYTFQAPGASLTSFSGINDAGTIVGSVLSGPFYAFVLNQGTVERLVVPGASKSSAYGINNAGVIVGWASTTGGFIATPQD